MHNIGIGLHQIFSGRGNFTQDIDNVTISFNDVTILVEIGKQRSLDYFSSSPLFQNRIAVSSGEDEIERLLFPIGDCVPGRGEKSRTRRLFCRVCRRRSYGNERTKIQRLYAVVQMLCHEFRILGSCAE